MTIDRSNDVRRTLWRYVRGPLGLVALLTLAVYIVLVVRILASVLYGLPTAFLLSTALETQIGRLNEIATGSCDSIGMQQFQRGEIGPIPSADSATVQTVLPAQQTARDAAPQSSPGVFGRSNRILNRSELRQLVQQSVVRVLTDEGSGTGFAIAPNLVVTNRHVIEGAAEGRIWVTSKFLGSDPVAVNLVATSPGSDLGNADFAVLELQVGIDLVPAKLGTDPEPLDNVIAAGFPAISVRSDPDEVNPDVVFSQGEVSVVQGQPNGIGLVIHTANIAPGSSGGPLLNRCGTIVGINTFVGMGDDAEGRALYSLSPQSLSAYLLSEGIDFESASSDCASGEE